MTDFSQKLLGYRAVLVVMALVAGLAVASCSRETRTPDWKPMGKVTKIEIHKSERRMTLFSGNVPVREFDVGLGSSPVGHKQERGDGKTPVGTYVVDRRNPNSQFHLSLGLSYPNEIDQVVANVRGIDPGDNIFIHGEPEQFQAPAGSRLDRRLHCRH